MCLAVAIVDACPLTLTMPLTMPTLEEDDLGLVLELGTSLLED